MTVDVFPHLEDCRKDGDEDTADTEDNRNTDFAGILVDLEEAVLALHVDDIHEVHEVQQQRARTDED